MLTAKKVFDALELAGVKTIGYQEIADDMLGGVVEMPDGMEVQVVTRGACLIRNQSDRFEFLVETDGVTDDALSKFADEVARHMEET